MERRAYILKATAETRAAYYDAKNRLARLEAEISDFTNPCARLTRLSDQRWDVSARVNYLAAQIDREMAAAAAAFDTNRAAA